MELDFPTRWKTISAISLATAGAERDIWGSFYGERKQWKGPNFCWDGIYP